MVTAMPSVGAQAPELYGPVQRGQTLWGIVSELKPRYPSMTRFELLEALHAANPDAFIGDTRQLRADAALVLPAPQAARELGFVNDDGSLGPADEELVRIWAAMRNEGLTPERGFGPADMASIQRAVDVLLASEIDIFTARLNDMDDDELGRVLDRIIPNINRAFALLHERRLRQFLQQITQQQKGDTA